MIKVKEQINGSNEELCLKGNMCDIVAYLEREQERCGKMTVSQYLRLRRLEKALSEQFGVKDIRQELENVF